MRIVPWLAAGALALAVGCASSNTSGPSGTATAPTPAPAAGGTANASGGIQNYTTGPSGQQNGFVLASGQRVHVPEELASKVSDQFPPNTNVQVSGHMITDSDGRQVLEADKITDPSRNLTLDLATARAGTPSPSAPAVGGSGAAGSQPATPPPTTQPQPGSLGTPPPGGK